MDKRVSPFYVLAQRMVTKLILTERSYPVIVRSPLANDGIIYNHNIGYEVFNRDHREFMDLLSIVPTSLIVFETLGHELVDSKWKNIVQWADNYIENTLTQASGNFVEVHEQISNNAQFLIDVICNYKKHEPIEVAAKKTNKKSICDIIHWGDCTGGGLFTALLDYEGLGYNLINDLHLGMRLVKGHANPQGGVVARVPAKEENGEPICLRDHYALIEWLAEKGLRRC